MTVTYQDVLRDELQYRRSRNPAYSLRAFARDLGFPGDVFGCRPGVRQARIVFSAGDLFAEFLGELTMHS